MKAICALVQKYLVAAATLSALGLVFPANASDKIIEGGARVIRFDGQARYSTDQKTWKELKKGLILKAPVVIQTAPRSIVDLCLREGKRAETIRDEPKENGESVIRIFENTALGINKLTTEKSKEGKSEEAQLDLIAGEMMGTVGKISETSKYEIKLPKGVIGIRGGTYIAASGSVLNVLAGTAIIAVAGDDGSMTTKKVSAGEGFDPTSGKVTRLGTDISPQPLSCDESKSTTPTTSSPTSGVPHGSGMGGALRKF